MNAQTTGNRPIHEEIGSNAEENFVKFLREFMDLEHATEPSQDDQPMGPYYARVLTDMRDKDNPTMTIAYDHLSQWDSSFADIIIENYLMVEPYLRKAVKTFVGEHFPDFLIEHQRQRDFYVSIVGLPACERLRDLRTDKVGRLVSFKGTVTRTSEVRPELFFGAFR